MKRFIAIIVCLLLIVCAAQAEDLDLSGMSFDELVKLKEKLNLAIWNSQTWQEVTVPPGIWEIGADIPAGHWSVRPAAGCGPDYIIYSDTLSSNGHDVEIMGAGFYIMECICDSGAPLYTMEYKTATDIDMKDGFFVRLDCTMIFSPYTGKPDLGFQ